MEQKEQIIVDKVDKKSKKIKKQKVQDQQEQDIQEKEREYLSYEQIVELNRSKLCGINKELKSIIKLDLKMVSKGIEELIKYNANQKKGVNNILESNDDFVYLEVILGRVPEKYTIRPQAIKLTHPIYNSTAYQSQFCIFSTDPQRQFKDKIQDMDIPCIAKVVGHQKLFKKYPTFMDKRALCNDFDLFFADHTIYQLITSLYGKVFYQRKKIPFAINTQEVPIDMQKQFGNDYQAYLNDLSNYTYFTQGNGPVYTFKVGRIDMSIKQIQQNIQDVVNNGIACLFKESLETEKTNDKDTILNILDSIHQINIKCQNTLSLPIFTRLSQKEIQTYFKE